MRITSNFTRAQYLAAVRKAKAYIRAGDAFQIVPSQRFSAKTDADPFEIYRALRVINPSPYLYFLRLDDVSIVGSSPEMLVKVQGSDAFYRPIAGTQPRGRDEDEDRAREAHLLADPKERAEHIMLVDLGRNDLGRVCEYGSVRVDRLMYVERYSHVMHLVSSLSGKLREGVDCFEALMACFPAGTLSGAPKVRAMEIIDELEPTRRGMYAGAILYLDFSGNLDSCIALRTLVAKNGRVYIQAGGGVVADSVPAREYQETVNKARAVVAAVEEAHGGGGRAEKGKVKMEKGKADPRPPRFRTSDVIAMILLLDNYDSFTYNLAQYLGQMGQTLLVRRNDQITLDEIADLAPERIVISPGPGTPKQAGISIPIVERFAGKIPILGVCLGHQAIGDAFGGRVIRAKKIMHGKTSEIHHDGKTIFRDLPQDFPATRYHSLIVERKSLPDELEISAETEDGTIMGLRHRKLKVEGVQFHPESVLTDAGYRLLQNFLSV